MGHDCTYLLQGQIKRTFKQMLLIHANTGTIQTFEEWKADYLSMPYYEWFGYESEKEMLSANDKRSWIDLLLKIDED